MVDFLQSKDTIEFKSGYRVTHIEQSARSIQHLDVEGVDGKEQIKGDYYVFAVQHNILNALLDAESRDVVPELADLLPLGEEWSTGVQFFLKTMPESWQDQAGKITIAIDSPWSLGFMINQPGDGVWDDAVVMPEDAVAVLTLIEIQAFVEKNIEAYTQFYRIITKKGGVRWVEDRTSVVEDGATGIRYHQGIVIDIHKRKVAEEKLRKSEEKYRRIVETAGEGFLLMDNSLRIVDLNSAYERMVGSSRSKLIGQKPFTENSESFQRFWSSGKEDDDREYRQFECELQSGNNLLVPVLVHASSLYSNEDELTDDMSATGRFMTLFYLTIGRDQKSIEWIRAGHDPALLYDSDLDLFEELKGPGLALGVDRNYVYQRQHKDGLEVNQLIIVGTDGIWEASGKTGEMFGKERFKDIIRRNASNSAEIILSAIFQEHAAFTKGMKTDDDVTLVIVKIV